MRFNILEMLSGLDTEQQADALQAQQPIQQLIQQPIQQLVQQPMPQSMQQPTQQPFWDFPELNTVKESVKEYIMSGMELPDLYETEQMLQKKYKQESEIKSLRKRIRHTLRTLEAETGEKLPEEPPVKGRTINIFDLLEIFRVLEYPIMNAIAGAIRGDTFSEVMKSVGKGFILKEKTQGEDVLELLGMKEGGERKLLGFLLSTALDPITWVGLGSLTKLGKLSTLKSLGKLTDVKEGTKIAKLIGEVFPGVPLTEAIKQIPELGATAAEQAKLGQRVLLKFFTQDIVRGEKVYTLAGKAKQTLLEDGIVGSLARLVGYVRPGAKEIIRKHVRLARGAEDLSAIEAAKLYEEFDNLVKPLADKGLSIYGKNISYINGTTKLTPKEVILRSCEDGVLSSILSDLAYESGGLSKLGKSARLMSIDKYIAPAEAAVKQMPVELINKLSIPFGSRKEAKAIVKGLITDMIHFVPPEMRKNFNPLANVHIRNMLISRMDDITGNPYIFEEMFNVIKPDDTFIKTMKDFLSSNMQHTESIEKVFIDNISDGTKQLFSNIVDEIKRYKNSFGGVGALIEAGAEPQKIFSYALRTAISNPPLMIAESPEMFSLMSSIIRVSNNGVLPETMKLSSKLIKKAGMVNEVGRILYGFKAMFTALPIDNLTPAGQIFVKRMNTRLSDIIYNIISANKGAGKRYKILSKLINDPDYYVGNKMLTTMFGQVKRDMKYIIDAVEKADKSAIKQLIRRRIIGIDDAYILSGSKEVFEKVVGKDIANYIINKRALTDFITDVDRTMLTDVLKTGYRKALPSLNRVFSQSVHRAISSFYKQKIMVNLIGLSTISQANFDNKILPRLLPAGSTIEDVIDAIRLDPNAIVPEHAYKIARTIKDNLEHMKEVEASLMLLRSSLSNYLPHVATKEWLDKYAVKFDGIKPAAFGLAKNLPFGKHRRIHSTILEINEILRQGGQPELFIDDPIMLNYIRSVGHAKAVNYNIMIKELINRFGSELGTEVNPLTGRLVKRIALTAEESKKMSLFKFENKLYKMPKDVVDYLNGVIRLTTNHEALKGFGKFWTQMLDFYRGITLGIYPAYHMRNMLSNMLNNFLSGVDNPYYYHLAKKIQKYGASLTDEFLTNIHGEKISMADFWREMMKRNIEGGGFFGFETGRFASEKVGYWRKMLHKPISLKEQFKATMELTKGVSPLQRIASPKYNPAFIYMHLAGRGIENNARWAQAIYSYIQGHTLEEARNRVAKYLFDYDDINTVIAKARELFPFIIWTRKNIPLQIEAYITKPFLATTTKRIFNEVQRSMLEDEEPLPKMKMPEYIRENVPIQVGKLIDGSYRVFLLGNWLPISDVDKLFNIPDTALNMLFPGIRLPVETLSNYNFFFKTPIDRGIPEETKRFMGIRIDPKVVNVLRALRPLNEANALFGLGDEEIRTTVTDRLARFFFGIKTFPVNPRQEELKRLREYAIGLGRKVAHERYRKQRIR